MKIAKMGGYANYTVQADKKIIDATGAKVKVVKGAVELTSDEGVKNKFAVEDIMEALKDNFYDAPVADGTIPQAGTEDEAEGEDSPEEIAFKARRKELQDAVKAAREFLLGDEVSVENLPDAKAKVLEAQKELDEFVSNHKKAMSPAQLEAETAFENVQTELEGAKAHYDFMKEEVIARWEALKAFRRVAKPKLSSVASRAPKLDYEKAQEIRKHIAETGDKDSVVAKHFEVSPYTIKCIREYVNYKLREGDVAYTPVPETVAPSEATQA